MNANIYGFHLDDKFEGKVSLRFMQQKCYNQLGGPGSRLLLAVDSRLDYRHAENCSNSRGFLA